MNENYYVYLFVVILHKFDFDELLIYFQINPFRRNTELCCRLTVSPFNAAGARSRAVNPPISVPMLCV